MRRSKSNPAKYAKHYQRISQRRMTNDDKNDDDKDGDAEEMARLRSIIEAYHPSEEEEDDTETKNKRRKKKAGDVSRGGGEEEKSDEAQEEQTRSILSPALQSELLGDAGAMDEDNDKNENELVVLPASHKKKKASKSKPLPLLTPEEVKHAKAARKKAERKLKQLAERSEKKKRRTELYQQLQETGISAQEQALLASSSRLGRGQFRTKRERLQRLLQKERAGLPLTEEEQGELYQERNVPESDDMDMNKDESAVGKTRTTAVPQTNDHDGNDSDNEQKEQESRKSSKQKKKGKKRLRNSEQEMDAAAESDSLAATTTTTTRGKSKATEVVGEQGPLSKAKKTRAAHEAREEKTPVENHEDSHESDVDDDNDDDDESELGDNDNEKDKDIEMEKEEPESDNEKDEESESDDDDESIDDEESVASDAKEDNVKGADSVHHPNSDNDEQAQNETTSTTTTTSSSAPGTNFVAMMMAGLSSLKTRTDQERKVLQEKEATAKAAAAEKEAQAQEEEARQQPKYIPSEPTPVVSPAVLGVPVQPLVKKNAWRILEMPNRPETTLRRDLPVAAMEYEIMNAVRHSQATILCGETGSGKSTQVPQFLYESGLTLGNAQRQGQDDALLIGVTQPRRVAAISTAKRVRYEMGLDDTDKKKKKKKKEKKKDGCLVAYQTRYESAGMGSATRIQFMTDGILLEEIKSDLLLRRYAVIVLDEAHERNLNTDVLLGLLSAALPLRQQAAAEGSLPPLKLVVMSATLRVEDFTRTFDNPQVVRVPGRTFPVTVHHSKVTELNDYERVAFQKVCKIHRKLPKGGILVFLTGRDEILRMVRRLRRALQGKNDPDNDDSKASPTEQTPATTNGPREMDDDELEGDVFDAPTQSDDFEEMEEKDNEEEEDDDDMVKEQQMAAAKGDGPDKVIVYPLYSMLSSEDQAKVFAPVPEGHRLIVVATNIAETSLTIPGISYVVDSGRQKCRNFHSATGVTSYDVMWISRAAADQRAGRAGRTGPGHCYRLYSSALYGRQMDAFALPEVVTRPLQDVVLAMKAMNVPHVEKFPFPTPPNRQQIQSAVQLLSSIGCIDTSQVEKEGGDGKITPLGREVTKLPLGVRYGKMLLSAARLGVLDYAIVIVAVLSESNPFEHANHKEDDEEEPQGEEKDEKKKDDDDNDSDEEKLDAIDQEAANKAQEARKRELRKRWTHASGDLMACLLAAGGYSYAGRGAGGAAEAAACRTFCHENGLNLVVMQRIHKMRQHLAKLVHKHLRGMCVDKGVAIKTGGILSSMPPPNKWQEKLLKQAIVSGLLDHIARKGVSDSGMVGSSQGRIHRAAYTSCIPSLQEAVYMDPNSAIYSRDWRTLPEWVCFDTLVRKPTKDGSTMAVMKNLTLVDPSWIATLAEGTDLLHLGQAMEHPLPIYDKERDAVLCCVRTTFGCHGWSLPSLRVEMRQARTRQSSAVMSDDSYRWFARYLLEGKVMEELQEVCAYWNDDPSILSRGKPVKKVALWVAALAEAKVDTAHALRRHWATKDAKFLFSLLKEWTKKEHVAEVKQVWLKMVKRQKKMWKDDSH